MNKEERSMKVERSIPVQARIDITALATMDAYFSSIGYNVRSMSQLVSQSVDLIMEVLSANDQLPKGSRFDTVAEANNYLNIRGLYQPGMKKRSMFKVATAIGFENLRADGGSPEMENPALYKQIHNQPRTTDLEDRLENPGKADITSPKLRGHSSDPRQLSEEELDEKAKYMIRKEQTQRELYEKMSKPVDEEAEEEKEDKDNE